MYKIVITAHFKKELKRLIRKNLSLKKELIKTLETFHKRTAVPIGMGLFKIRLKTQGKGKSGGYRVYIFIMEVEGILTPIFIYPKNEKESLTKDEIIYHLTKTKEELQKLL